MSYILIYAIIPYIIYLFSVHHRKPNLLFIYLLILTIIRFDNVTDYSMYIGIFQNISNGIVYERISAEAGYILLNKIFSFWDYGYIFIIAISSAATYYTMYLYFKKNNVIAFAMLLFCAYGMYMLVDNTIRQNIAFATLNICFFRYLYKGKQLWHIIPAGIVASTFHTSALIAVPIFFLLPSLNRKIMPFNKVFIITVIIYVLMLMGVFEAFVSSLLDSLLPSLGVVSDRFLAYMDFEYSERGFSIVLLFKVIIATLPVLIIDEVKDKKIKMFINITWIVNIISLILQGAGGIGGILMRVIRYLFIFEYISIAYFFLFYKGKLFGVAVPQHFLRNIVIIPLFALSVTFALNYFGATSNYTTIFGSRCKNFLVYNRPNGGFLITAEEKRENRNKYNSMKP